jgi:lipid A disaccharide synthetase
MSLAMNSGIEMRAVLYGQPGAASMFPQTHLERLGFADVLGRLHKSIKAIHMLIKHEIDPRCLVENPTQS